MSFLRGKLTTNTSAIKAHKKEVHAFLEKALCYALGEKTKNRIRSLGRLKIEEKHGRRVGYDRFP